MARQRSTLQVRPGLRRTPSQVVFHDAEVGLAFVVGDPLLAGRIGRERRTTACLPSTGSRSLALGTTPERSGPAGAGQPDQAAKAAMTWSSPGRAPLWQHRGR